MDSDFKPVIQIANPNKIARVKISYEELQKLTKDKGVIVSYNMNQEDAYPFNTIGSVSIRTKKLKLNDCRWFSEVSKLANNIAVTPYLDGTFEYCLTFIETLITISDSEEEV